MNYTNVRHYRLFHEMNTVQIPNHPFINPGPCLRLFWFYRGKIPSFVIFNIIKRRYINTLQLCYFLQKSFSATWLSFPFPFHKGFRHFRDNFFSFSQNEEIKKISNRLRIINGRATAYYKSILIIAVLGPNWNPSQIQHIKNIGIYP